jgi:tetratricopeptide (TPR) repeat protein
MSNEELSTFIQTLDSAFGVVFAIVTVLFARYKYLKAKKYKKATYYVVRGVFADRKESIYEMLLKVKDGYRIINVYGKRGMGKSSFLRYFCDFTNKTLRKENQKNNILKQKIKNISGRAFYVELSGSKSIEGQIIERISDKKSTFSEFVDQMSKRVSAKKIFIVIDNINNAGLSREVELVADVFLSHSSKYYIIVGSIEKQPFLNITNDDVVNSIELNAFNDADVFEFADGNNKTISQESVLNIIDFSQGLPVFVSLLLNNAHGNLSETLYDNDRMNKYIGRIIDDLDVSIFSLILYIGFLSVTMTVINIPFLELFVGRVSKNELTLLENSALIEFDRENGTIKMHELFRNYICSKYLGRTDVSEKIYNYYAQNDFLQEQTYYIIMLSTNEYDDKIIEAINSSVESENFSYLLSLGEHYKRLHDWNFSDKELNPDLFLHLVYGYVEGLIGVGNYPAAREIVDKCKISSRSIGTYSQVTLLTRTSAIQLKFSFLTAQLYHLQNNYDEAISTYEILLNNNVVTQTTLEIKCYWGIAHSLRHQGYDYDMAINYYNRAINKAIELGIQSEIIKNMREKLIIYLLTGNKANSEKLFDEINKRIECLPSNGYKATKISFLKCCALYSIVMSGGNSQRELKLLHETLEAHKKQKKRIQYNTLFEIGEYHRKQRLYSTAAENYNSVLTFSRRNKDHNLETMTLIAITVNDICSGMDLQAVLEKRHEAIIQAYEDSEEYNLYTNKLLADMVLSFIQGTHLDSETRGEFKRLKYFSAIKICDENNAEAYHELNLFLM